MFNDEQLTMGDLVSVDQLRRVIEDAVARAPMGMAVVDAAGEVLLECHPAPACCPDGGERRQWRRFPIWAQISAPRHWGSLITCSRAGEGDALAEAVVSLTVERLRDLVLVGCEMQSLCREIVATYEQLTLLYSSAMQVGAVHEVDGICRQVVEQVEAQAPSQAVAVLLLDEETGRARVVEARGELSDAFHVPMPGMPNGVLSSVLETGEPALVCDVPRMAREDTTSILCVPLIANERLLGAVCARDKLSGEEYLAGDAKLIGAIAAQAAVALSNAMLFRDVKHLFLGTVRSLASAVDAKDPYTSGHSQRVTQYALAIAREMGIPPCDCEDLQLAALLHDVGKIGLPDQILLKAGKLTPDEWRHVRRHPILGEEILRPIKQLRQVATWIRHEHERWNGSGYPDQLRGEAIPLPSRIIAVADAFDALTSDRSYRRAVAVREAILILRSAAGSEYDPAVIAAFLTAFEGGRISK